MTTVELKDLTKTYASEGADAVQSLSLMVASQQIVALLGPSGSGKSTTLKMIAGLLRPTAGEICFDGQDMSKVPAERRSAVMVFQNHLLFPHMSVGQNIGFGMKMRGAGRQAINERVAEMLELVQLPGIEKRRPGQLSGGQQQRVALARALVTQPKVLLLDEPLSNLDAHLRDEMRELIRSIQTRFGITTIFVTHDQEEAVVLADKVALLFEGQLHQYAQPSAFYERPATERVARFFGGVNFVPGKVTRNGVETPLGRFHAPHCEIELGQALLSIRPEAVEIDRESVQTDNTLSGVVESRVYMGRYARFKVAAAGHMIEVTTEPSLYHQFTEGDALRLYLPPEKIWVLPPDA